MIGACYLTWLSFKTLFVTRVSAADPPTKANSLATAIKINLLSPYPYLFWFTIGGAYIALGKLTESLLFVFIALGTLVLSKIIIALVTANFRQLLNSEVYLWVMRLLGFLLFIFALTLFKNSYIL